MRCTRKSRAGHGGAPCLEPAFRRGFCKVHYERTLEQVRVAHARWLVAVQRDPEALEAWKRKQRKRSLANYYKNRVGVLMYNQLLLLAFPELRAARRVYDKKYQKRARRKKRETPPDDTHRIDVDVLMASREAAAEEARRKEMEQDAADHAALRKRLDDLEAIGRAEVIDSPLPKRKRKARRWLARGVGVGEDVDQVVPDDDLHAGGLVDEVEMTVVSLRRGG